MWPRCIHTLAPITKLVSTSDLSTKDKKSKLRPIDWTHQCQEAFDEMKRLVSREVLLAHPNLKKPFHIYTDASNYQLGAVITQDNRPLAYFSRKLTETQKGTLLRSRSSYP